MPRRNVPSRPRTSAPRTRRLPAKPRRALGQHFLHDETMLERIVREGGFTNDEQVLEVGGGTGELTERLARASGHVVSVELDEVLCSHLRLRMIGFDNCGVVCANVLDHPPAQLLAEGGGSTPYALAGNVPYYITAPIFRHFLGAADRPARMVLLVQREVAESLAAGPGKMSLLGVSVQMYADVRVLFSVPAKAFTPPPKVESAVVRVDVRARPAVDVEDEERFFQVVRAGFRTPRKQLHNAIATGMWLPPDSAPDLLRSAGIDPVRRAQTMSLEEWAALTRAYSALKREIDDSRVSR
ncbi:MAG: ribosomal RNA small subunit methyltransferase A [Chloroflexi bacterium]|nr:ribosomal RNA small subunit methyltransferase A [Chloroflexota bacterium]